MTQTCISTSTVTSSPDQRVAYAHGMVLGVDDLVTEQNYWLYHRYLAQRGLAGMGTVYGLQVTASAVDRDAEVRVSPGLLVDQFGRDAVIRCPQCARLGQWLTARELAQPGTIGEHRDPSGVLTVYVVARYDQCLDTFVPLPGSPCSTSDELMTPSRIRDSWEVDLSFDRPAMPRWDTDRRLARLLSLVDAVPGLPEADSDEPELIAAVLDLINQADDGPGELWPPTSPPDSAQLRFTIPAEAAPDVLDRLFVVWVTQVRPVLLPDLTSPPGIVTPSDPAPVPEILLATLTFSAADPFDVASPEIAGPVDVDDAGRPYLLHSQLLQLLGVLEDDEVVRPQEIAQLSAQVTTEGQLAAISVWFSADGIGQVDLPERVMVTLSDGTGREYRSSPVPSGPFSARWRLIPVTPTSFLTVTDGELVRVTFSGADTQIGTTAESRALRQVIDDGLVLVNADAEGNVAAYATAWIDQVGTVVPPASPQASVEFATLTPSVRENKVPELEIWFHPQPRGPVDDVLLFPDQDLAVEVFDEQTGNAVPIQQTTRHPTYTNVWTIVTDAPRDGRQPWPAYLRLRFIVDKIVVEVRGNQLTLGDWIDKAEILFIGWDPRERIVTGFSRHTVQAR
ncbi:hypothetical protein MLP_22760 [Microlunatus phosphovorus NM-1]|uniref:Uncharacterized protein n=1 Tax=Microlunatus phosphovorus (strain ATCC 700054 / DSM 10555 / JCM 9379 / NBRC 101784 / NCIMB 13414 / VKM Ac-1990 / NM-1) TaxID=1032480 RepID=F5XES4_MICPN|nr:hypothetical protein [Microlunatus phosphovorus]BAK35290.1 hypothetical protein MLP_22760 [Microlunatus phosphovorus NM-1]